MISVDTERKQNPKKNPEKETPAPKQKNICGRGFCVLQFLSFVFLNISFMHVRGGYAPFVGGDAYIAPMRIKIAYRDDVGVVPYEFDSFSG